MTSAVSATACQFGSVLIGCAPETP